MEQVIFTFRSHRTTGQLSRYAFVGISSNLVAYLVYLVLTDIGMAPKSAMTVVYLAAATISFLANRYVTFARGGTILRSGLRFFVAQGIGYFLNLLILVIFVDWLHNSYRIVQAVAILIVASYLFAAMKFFVFRQRAADAVAGTQ